MSIMECRERREKVDPDKKWNAADEPSKVAEFVHCLLLYWQRA